jgi:hypothetical protein
LGENMSMEKKKINEVEEYINNLLAYSKKVNELILEIKLKWKT